MILRTLFILAILLLITLNVDCYEMFGFSGLSRTPALKEDRGLPGDISDLEEVKVTNATPDLIHSLVQPVMKHFEAQGSYMYPIETNSVSKIGDKYYKCSFTFVRQDTGFPTGVVVNSIVELPSGKVYRVSTPAVIDISGDVQAHNAPFETATPTIDALRSLEK